MSRGRRAVTVVVAAAACLGSATTVANAGSSKTVAPKAVLALSPAKATVGQKVTADLHKSRLPKHTRLRKLTISWGDGSKAVRVKTTTLKPSHVYIRPGRYVVKETLTDSKHKTVHTSKPVTVTQKVYWDLFDGSDTKYQLEQAALPLTATSRSTVIPGTPGNKLACTSGMTSDAKGRLWVLSYPGGCGAAATTGIINVFQPPVTSASKPVLTFTFPLPAKEYGLSFDPAGNLWVTDAYYDAVYKFDGPFTKSKTLTVALKLWSGLIGPAGVVVDSSGNVIVANGNSTGTDSIAVFHKPTNTNAVPVELDGLSAPGGLVLDAHGDLYASNNPSNGVGAAIVRYNKGDLAAGDTPSVVDSAGMTGVPYAANLALDASGNLYDADCGSSAAIRVYPTAHKKFSTTLAPTTSYMNASINDEGCAWGITIP